MTDTNSKAQVTDARLKRSDVEEVLSWLDGALECTSWNWSPDQWNYADDARKRVRAALAAQEKPEPSVAVREAAAFLLWYKDRGKNTDDCVEAWDALRTALRSPVEITPEKIDAALVAPSPDLPEGEVDLACPVCLVPLLPDDICATDIEMGICHAECLEGSPVVDLDTGDELPNGTLDTFRYGDTDPTSPSPIDKGEVK